MSASNAFENALMLLFFQGTTWANVAQNASSSPITSWQESLHTADPGEAGDQTTSEATYTNYARTAVARTSGGFTVSNNTATHTANVDFPAGGGGSGTVTYFGLGTASSSTGILELSGTVTPNIVTGSGVTPRLTTSTSFSLD